jgi:hypothetical protein
MNMVDRIFFPTSLSSVSDQQEQHQECQETGGPIGIAWSTIRQMYLCKRGGMIA